MPGRSRRGSQASATAWRRSTPVPKPKVSQRKQRLNDLLAPVSTEPSQLVSRVGAVNQPDRTELEQAILRHLVPQPPSDGREGTLRVRVTELERVTHPPDSRQFRGGLF